MALLTLEAEQAPCCWSAVEKKLACWRVKTELVTEAGDKQRTYKLNLPDHGHIALFGELQSLLVQEGVHFFIDTKP